MVPGAIVGVIVWAFLAAYGLYRLYQYYTFYHHVYSRSAWPRADGTVIGGYTGYTPGMRGGRNYYAVIEYRYDVNGSEYMGKVKRNTIGGEGQAKRLIEKFPAESTLRVHYNPVKPEEHVSVLDKSTFYLVVSWVLVALGFLAIFTAFVAR